MLFAFLQTNYVYLLTAYNIVWEFLWEFCHWSFGVGVNIVLCGCGLCVRFGESFWCWLSVGCVWDFDVGVFIVCVWVLWEFSTHGCGFCVWVVCEFSLLVFGVVRWVYVWFFMRFVCESCMMCEFSGLVFDVLKARCVLVCIGMSLLWTMCV